MKRLVAVIVLCVTALLAAQAASSSSPAPPASAPRAVGQAAPAKTRVVRPGVKASLQHEFSSSFIDECLEVADQLDPQMADRLRSLCEVDQNTFERIMRLRGRHLVGLVELRHREPELYQTKLSELRIEVQVNRVARKLRAAQREDDAATVDVLESQLRGLLRLQMALSLKARGDYIRRLEEHIEALRVRLAEEAEQFNETVEARMATLTDPNGPPAPDLLDLGDLFPQQGVVGRR